MVRGGRSPSLLTGSGQLPLEERDQLDDLGRAAVEVLDLSPGRVVHVLPRLELDLVEAEGLQSRLERPGSTRQISAQSAQRRRAGGGRGVPAAAVLDVLAGHTHDQVGIVEVPLADLTAAVPAGGPAGAFQRTPGP